MQSHSLCVFGLMARRSAKIPDATAQFWNPWEQSKHWIQVVHKKCAYMYIYIIAQIYAIRIISYYIILYHIISIILCVFLTLAACIMRLVRPVPGMSWSLQKAGKGPSNLRSKISSPLSSNSTYWTTHHHFPNRKPVEMSISMLIYPEYGCVWK